jgi:D-3-phosphoglycerate dehydrogenase / 2-oxoglutarate reductase
MRRALRSTSTNRCACSAVAGPTVLVSLEPPAWDDDRALAALTASGLQVRREPCGPATTTADLARHLQGCTAVLAGPQRYTGELFEAVPTLRHVARVGAGHDGIDLAAATARGVLVTTTPGTNAESVADHTFALLLALARHIGAEDRAIRQGAWPRTWGVEMWGKTLGLVGLGRIGQAVARRALGFSMRLLAYEPQPDEAFVAAHGVELVDLETLLRRSDVVSIHIPLTPATAGLLGREQLALLQPTAFLVNTARGGIVDEDALHELLASGQLGGAALDVRTTEPPRDPRLGQHDNVVLTSHVGGQTREAWERTVQMAVDDVLRAQRGERPVGLVNPAAWPG